MANLGAVRRRITFAMVLAVLLPRGLAAENWPQWRGPSSQGVSSESGLSIQWSPGNNIAWGVSLAGFGASSPIVWGDRVFTTSQIGSATVARGSHPLLARDDPALAGREHAMGGSRMESAPGGDVFLVVEAFRWSDGSRLWEHRVKAEGEFPQLHEKHNLATPAPVADGERVYAWFGNGQLVALGMDGKAVWTRHLGREYSPFQTPWGHGSSPTLYRDLLILLCDHARESYLVALDRRTGKERWKADRGRGRASHSTPLVVPAPGGDELIVNSSERIDAYDPATGKLLWHAGGTRQTPIPSAVFHDGVIYLSRGYRNSDYLAIRPGGRGDVTATHIKWRAPGGASYVPSVVQYQGLLYLTNEIGVVTCAEAETGETFVLRARRKPEVLARNDLGERFIASPAISSGRLFLRSDGKLFAVGK
jgi:outer membrane protein assembly factor BamB